jgi:hypothetical protein
VTVELKSGSNVIIPTLKCPEGHYMVAKQVMDKLPRATRQQVEERLEDLARLVTGGRDKKSDAAIASMSKDCPNCQMPISKDGGCNHMTCRVCKHEFFWDTLKPYRRPW